MTDREAVLTAYHEASHTSAAFLLGRQVETVSIRPSQHFVGATIFAEWPPFTAGTVRRAFEEAAITTLAGPLGEALAPGGPRVGYSGENPARSADEAAVEALTSRVVPRPTPDEEAGLLLVESQRIPPDHEAAETLVEELVPGDEENVWATPWVVSAEAERAALLQWLRIRAARLVFADPFPALVRALVPTLLRKRVLGREAIELILRPIYDPTRRDLLVAARARGEEES